MPNHVTNILTISGEQAEIDKFVEAFTTFHPTSQHQSHDGSFTYNNEDGEYGWLNKETNKFARRGEGGMYEVDGVPEGFTPHMNPEVSQFPDFEKIIPMPQDKKDSIGESGMFPAWYSWSTKNWGTKWNSYSHEKREGNVYKFETAWSPVPNLVLHMQQAFPTLTIEYKWADEDTGSNTGRITFSPQGILEDVPNNLSREAYELAFEIDPSNKDYYRLVGDNYEYYEEEEESEESK